ncbi:hypothetical protein QWM81_06815 [Streptomyces ficellus]|uniref:Secreted protein n=1 Tax=Streptomyces ficellus TaxID=1977088 RepID=A0ABT7Z3Q0_9ACTN|nr:hypothetical protein [Streptomyces ficellus]MDN3293756.1 hypothetical protein [Streptomyces ficellus]
MARMRRGLVHALAWSLATGAAVTLSWWGVHTVMAGTAYDPPRALPLATDRPAARVVEPQASSTQRPASPTPSSPPSPRPSVSAAPGGSRAPSPSREGTTAGEAPAVRETPKAPEKAGTGEVKSYTVDGGRVAFDIGASSAELVSATPAAGWQMQVWKQPTYIRVTFSRDGTEIDVFCTWHDHAPTVRIEERR